MSPLSAFFVFIFSLMLSAFFSGSETGFYRLNRIRLIFDARLGDRVAGMLLWLTNHPTLFVGAILVGNNLANYLTSFAIVSLVSQSPYATRWGELGVTILLSPIVFVYAELLPKSIFFRAPNRLIRIGGPLMLLCVVLFSPLAALLWGVGWLMQQWIGETPLQFQQSVARHELQQMLQEGHDEGLLMAAQQRLSRNLFGVASRPVAGFCTPAHRLLEAQMHDPKEELLEQAAQRGLAAAPVRSNDSDRWQGYVRVVDLYLDDSPTIERVRPIPQVLARDTHLEALMQLQECDEEIAEVLDANGEVVGLVYTVDLITPLFHAS